MKAYNFDDKDPITKLRFLAYFKRACVSREGSEGTALCVMPTFVRDRPASSLTAWISPHKDDGTAHRLQKTHEEQNSTYVEAVNFLLKSYAINYSNAMATSDIECLKKVSMDTSVQLADVFRLKVVRTLWKCVSRRAHLGGVYWWSISHRPKCSKVVSWLWAWRASLGDWPVSGPATVASQTSVEFGDGTCSEKPCSKRLSNDSHRGCRWRTKVWLTEDYWLYHAKT